MNTAKRRGNPTQAIAYLRVSTTEQHLGPEAQKAAIDAWAKREGVTVVSVFSDAGVSGGTDLDARPGLVAALSALRASHAGVLVVAKRDRLARDVYVAATIDRAVVAAGARVASADGVGNGDSASDAFMRTILDGAAAYERALIRARTKAALVAKRARGERAGAVPYGYRLAADGVHLDENAAEQGVVVVVRELRAAGLSLRAVVRALESRGLMARSGRPFQPTQIARMERAAA